MHSIENPPPAPNIAFSRRLLRRISVSMEDCRYLEDLTTNFPKIFVNHQRFVQTKDRRKTNSSDEPQMSLYDVITHPEIFLFK
jgi:hypothetical protein